MHKKSTLMVGIVFFLLGHTGLAAQALEQVQAAAIQQLLDVLGLVIEQVSGQSYERFMREQVLRPLGLHDTFMYKEPAQATGRLSKGDRTSFLVAMPYEAPVFEGNKPAGYIISSAQDVACWMGIQMG